MSRKSLRTPMTFNFALCYLLNILFDFSFLDFIAFWVRCHRCPPHISSNRQSPFLLSSSALHFVFSLCFYHACFQAWSCKDFPVSSVEQFNQKCQIFVLLFLYFKYIVTTEFLFGGLFVQFLWSWSQLMWKGEWPWAENDTGQGAAVSGGKWEGPLWREDGAALLRPCVSEYWTVTKMRRRAEGCGWC